MTKFFLEGNYSINVKKDRPNIQYLVLVFGTRYETDGWGGNSQVPECKVFGHENNESLKEHIDYLEKERKEYRFFDVTEGKSAVKIDFSFVPKGPIKRGE